MLRGWEGKAEQIGMGGCRGNLADSTKLQCDGINDHSTNVLEPEEKSESGNDSRAKAVAYTDGKYAHGCRIKRKTGGIEFADSGGANLADAVREREREREQRIIYGSADAQEREESGKRQDRPRSYGFGRWPTEPGMGRVANGMAYRADRLKAIGNGQVSRVAATAWRILSK